MLDEFRIFDSLPDDYRWATAAETELATFSGEFSRFVMVKVGGTDDEPDVDLAISKTDPDMDKHGNLIAVEGDDRCACGSTSWEFDECAVCARSIEHVLAAENEADAMRDEL